MRADREPDWGGAVSIRQRFPRQHDAKHLAFVRASGCCIPFCKRPAESAHVRMACIAIGKRSVGMQEKPDDRWTVGLCAYHHRTGKLAQHNMGEADFWSLMGLNPFAIADRLWIESGGAARAEQPQRVKQPRKIAPRPEPAKRRKITGRPKIASAGFPTGLRKRMDGRVERRTT